MFRDEQRAESGQATDIPGAFTGGGEGSSATGVQNPTVKLSKFRPSRCQFRNESQKLFGGWDSKFRIGLPQFRVFQPAAGLLKCADFGIVEPADLLQCAEAQPHPLDVQQEGRGVEVHAEQAKKRHKL